MPATAAQNVFHYAFISDLMAQYACHKFIDDFTLTEILRNDTSSTMREITDELMKWSQDTKMLINCNKTTEMFIGKAKLENIGLPNTIL